METPVPAQRVATRAGDDHGSPRAAVRHARGVIALAAVAAAALGVGCAAPATGTHPQGSTTSSSADQAGSSEVLPNATSPSGRTAEPATPTATPAASIATPAQPAGFQPEVVTAVSESQYWVLGTDGPCNACTTPLIWHTTDGGQTFSSIPAPPAPLGYGYPGSTNSISDLRFADGVDGWAFGPELWATHDDGERWEAINLQGQIGALEPGGGGYVYAVVDLLCPAGGDECPVEVVRSAAASDTWSVVLTLDGESEPPPSLGVHGADVWLLTATGLWRSLDDGASFVQLPSPCSADLGGRIDPVNAAAVWAFCPTGMEGGPWVSTNGGVSFTSAYGTLDWSNGAMVSALSADTAFLTGIGGLDETEDGGVSYRFVPAFGGGSALWVGFTDTSVGYAWVVDQLATGSQLQLWRTGDGGDDWTLVILP